MKRWLLAFLLSVLFHPALAQSQATVVATCGTPPATYKVGSVITLFVDQTGNLCSSATLSGSISVGSVSQGAKGADASADSWYVQPGTGATFPISAASLPLPTGAATAAGLTTINTTLGTPFQAGGALGAGSAIIGKVGIDQTTPGTTNAVQATNFPTGLTATGNALDINIKTGNPTTIAATQSGTWTVQPGNTANTTPWLVQAVPQSTGGMSIFSKIVANNTTSFAVDASAGTLYSIIATANGTAPAYIKLYNTAQGSVTCGTPTPVDRIMIPANATTATGGGIVWSLPGGAAYSTAITACVTGGIADNDTTAPAASTFLVSFYYK